MEHKNTIAVERNHLFEPDCNVAVLVNIKSFYSREEIKNAVKTAVFANEILFCRIEIDSDGVAYFEKNAEPKYELSFEEDTAPTDVIIREKSRLFHIEDGEFLRVFAFETAVLVILHHIAADGISATYFTADILDALSGKKPAFKPMRLMTKADFPKGSELPLWVSALFTLKNREWAKSGKIFNFVDRAGMFENYNLTHKTFVRTYTFTQEQTALIVRKSKDLAVTVNSLAATAISEASGIKTDIGFAVNLRGRNNNRMGNFASGSAINIEFNSKKTFAENAQSLHALIRKKLDSPSSKYYVMHYLTLLSGTLLDAMCMCIYGGYENKTAQETAKISSYEYNKKELSLSNLGTPFGKRDDIESALFVPPVIPNATRVFGAVTAGGKLCLTLHTTDERQAAHDACIFDKTIENLLKYIGE